MNPSGMILAALKPELREKIEQLADLGWMTPVLALREWVSKQDGMHPLPVALNLEIDKLNHHFDLLQTFLASAAEDVREWSSQTRLHELRSVLFDLIPYLPPSAQQFFMIYDEVAKRVESFTVNAFPADAALLLSLADTCFEVMVGVEHLPYSALP